MKLVLTTIMLLTSLTGLSVCAYLQKWDMVITTAPFTMQFGYMLHLAYVKYIALINELEQLRSENRALRQLIKKLNRRGFQ